MQFNHSHKCSQQFLPRKLSMHSLTIIGIIIKAATGSAHHQPKIALRRSPPSRITDRYAQISVGLESASNARLLKFAATFRFARAGTRITEKQLPLRKAQICPSARDR